jgi:ribonuclease HI
MNTITIYTDGACKSNGKHYAKGGYGIFFGENDSRNISEPLTGDKITNQVAELKAILVAIESVKDDYNKIIIKTDSMYSINCITKWADKWKLNNWKKSDGKVIENKELITTIYDYYMNHDIEFHHIRSHMAQPDIKSPKYNDWYGNMMADMLANKMI